MNNTLDLEILEELYDLSEERGTEAYELNEGLTDGEIKEAEFFNQFRCGVMVITGDPGAGKDTFMHYILWKLKLLFKDFRVLLDRKPRLLFGRYTPFDESILIEEWKGLSQKYKSGKSDIKHDFAKFSAHKDELNALIESWNAGHEGLFTNAGLGLTEFWRYFNNREPHNPINKACQPLMKRYRHLGLLVIGTTPYLDELDQKRCLKYITHELRCMQTTKKGVHVGVLLRRRFFNGTSVVVAADENPPALVLNALQPRERLNGKCYYDLFNSWEKGESAVKANLS